MAKKRIFNISPKRLYEACKAWRDHEETTLTEVWDRVVRDSVYRKYVIHAYEIDLAWGD